MVFKSAQIAADSSKDLPAPSGSLRIAINCRSFMNKQYTGIGRYACRLVHALKDIDPINRYLLYAPKGFFNTKRVIPKIKAKNITVKADRLQKGVVKTLGDFDIYHSPSPDIFDAGKAKIVVTIHDLIYKAYPEGHTTRTLRLTDDQMKFLLPITSRFICCSENTARDLKRFFDVAPERIRVIYPGIDNAMFYPLKPDQKRAVANGLKTKNIPLSFILFVGTLEPRKNLKNLLKAFSLMKQHYQYPGQLVVCGMAGWDNEDLSKLTDDLNIQSDVRFLGFVNDDHLRELYNLTDCFVFPSFYEGFGYPIVEAFSCGAPVVTTTVASCPETAKDGAVLVEPADVAKLAAAIMNVINDSELREDLIEKGFARAKEFNVLNTARQTLQVYKEVYEN